MTTLTILIVEDDPSNRLVVEVMLSRSGHRILTCENGQEALALCLDERETIDLILMDVQMPVMDGLEAMRQLRAHPRTRQIPIICLSAKASTLDQESGVLAGADAYLTKPFLRRDLLDLIAEVMARRV